MICAFCGLGQNLMPEVSIVNVRTEFAAETDGQGETSELFAIFTGILSGYRSSWGFIRGPLEC